MPPNPKMPHTPPASMRFISNWLNAPAASAACSTTSRFAAASAIASACSAIGSAYAPPLLAIGRPGGSVLNGMKSTPALIVCNSRALPISASSCGRSSVVFHSSTAPALRSAASRARVVEPFQADHVSRPSQGLLHDGAIRLVQPERHHQRSDRHRLHPLQRPNSPAGPAARLLPGVPRAV